MADTVVPCYRIFGSGQVCTYILPTTRLVIVDVPLLMQLLKERHRSASIVLPFFGNVFRRIAVRFPIHASAVLEKATALF
jgi:hypothetical protein